MLATLTVELSVAVTASSSSSDRGSDKGIRCTVVSCVVTINHAHAMIATLNGRARARFAVFSTVAAAALARRRCILYSTHAMAVTAPMKAGISHLAMQATVAIIADTNPHTGGGVRAFSMLATLHPVTVGSTQVDGRCSWS
jgi:hypothetical protein